MNVEISKVERINWIISQELDVLKLSFTEQLSIIWGWFWRSLLITIVVLIISSGAGFLIGLLGGLIIDAMNLDIVKHQIYISLVGGIFGFCIGLYSIVFLIKWITQKNIGNFRFVLIQKV